MMKNNLIELRNKIIAVDEQLLKLLAERRDISQAIAQEKLHSSLAVRDRQREQELLKRLIQLGASLYLDESFILQLYQIIIEDSVALQQRVLKQKIATVPYDSYKRISFLGPKGSYSHLAAQQFAQQYHLELNEQSVNSFNEAILKVETGKSDLTILPIENNSSGAISEVYDLLQATSLQAIGELIMPIHHGIFSKVKCPLIDITKLYSHPQPVQQCSQYLRQFPDITIEYCNSSSAALEKVAESMEPHCAALGHIDSGALYHLQLIATNISNEVNNSTRFIVLSRDAPTITAENVTYKTTLLMSTGQQPGALVDALIILKNYQISITKLESRPIKGKPWEVMFYIDLEANIQDPETQQAIHQIKKMSRYLKILGCYPAALSPTFRR